MLLLYCNFLRISATDGKGRFFHFCEYVERSGKWGIFRGFAHVEQKFIGADRLGTLILLWISAPFLFFLCKQRGKKSFS